MVSSSVYRIEDLLDQVYALLNGFGYEVWMSHQGTIPVDPGKSAFETCLLAVEKCDLFLSIITPQYGTGVATGELGISHRELLKAIALNKPRWILAHSHVVFARSLFRKLGGNDCAERTLLLEKLGFADEAKLRDLRKRESGVMDDFRVIDMYEAAIQEDVALQDRKGNWVQKYEVSTDVLRFLDAQFADYDAVEQFLKGGKHT